jgi:hypothetical protein
MIMPHQVCHAHCPKGGGSGAVLVLLAVVVLAAIARPVVHAASVVLQVVLITAASVAGLAVIAGVTYGAVRVYRRQAMDRQAISRHARTAQALSARPVAAIEAPRPGLADLRVLAAQHGYEVIRQPGSAPED